MKKCLLAVICVLVLFVTTGCGKNQVKCTASSTENGVKMDAEVVATFDSNDKLTDAVITYDLNDKTVASQYCAIFKLAENAEKDIKVTCSGTKVTITGYANLESEEDDESLKDLTKEEFVKRVQESEEAKFTCK